MIALAKTITNAEVEEFARDWYHKLDIHVPMVDLLPGLANEDLILNFPEGSFYGHSGFEQWYQTVVRLFFDEVHTVKSVETTLDGDQANVKVVVYWEASVWNAPEANSKRIMLDAYQTWVVKRLPDTDALAVYTYTVDEIVYKDGSAQL